MKTQIDLTPIIEIIISAFSLVVSFYIIPYLKQKLSDEKREKLRVWTEIAVRAAEQLYGSKTGQQKKDYAVSFLLSKGLVFDVDEVTAMIESEVHKLSSQHNYE